MNERIIEKFNREIGSDYKNLHKCESLLDNFKVEFNDIEAKLSLGHVNTTSKLKSTLFKHITTNETVQTEIEKLNQFNENITGKLSDYDQILDDVSDSLERIRKLEYLVEYFKIVQDIQDVSNHLKSCINGKDEQKCVGLYLALFGEANSSNSIIGRLETIEAFHLKAYAINTAIFWHNILKEKFTKDFENLLKTIKWPYQGSQPDQFNPSKDSLQKLSSLAEYLFLIKSPIDIGSGYVTITSTILCPPISTPIQLLLKPFRQRFFYHFSGAKITNRLDKPEWFFTQILAWAKDNHIFIATNFQNAALLAGHSDLNVRLEFIRGLVQLAIEKLCSDIEEICQDDHLFAHLLDETLSFEQELKETLGYPNSFPSAISVMTQGQYLQKWLQAEEKFSTDKMEEMLKTGNPWIFIDPNNMEELKIPKCADQFIRLLDAIKDRYCNLPQPGHQLQFLNLQLELIESFRRRLVQLHNSGSVDESVSTTKILNTINYITAVFREWGENVHYLHLHAALLGPNPMAEIESVFDDCNAEFEHWQTNLMKSLANNLVDEIKAKSSAYRHDIWISMAEQNIKEPFLLTGSASGMFELMVKQLHDLEMELSVNLLSVTVRLIAHQLDDFFINSMIMNTKFSSGGAAQFQFDMIRNLFALFGQYVRRPDLLFKKIHDACILLTLQTGNALLLHKTIQDSISHDLSRIALTEIGVLTVHPVMACDILERRKDIFTY